MASEMVGNEQCFLLRKLLYLQQERRHVAERAGQRGSENEGISTPKQLSLLLLKGDARACAHSPQKMVPITITQRCGLLGAR